MMKTTNKHVIKVELFEPYQKQKDILYSIIYDTIKYVTVVAGRQVGKTKLLEQTVLYTLFQANKEIGFISPTLKQARKVFRQLEGLIYSVNSSYVNFIINRSDLIIRLKNTNSSIQFFSNEAAESIRGNTFTHLFIDESKDISDLTYKEVLLPTVLVKGEKVIAVGTPGPKNWFYDNYNLGLAKHKNYITHTLTSYDNPYIDDDEIETMKASMPEKVYRAEILGEFVDQSGMVFDTKDYHFTLSQIEQYSGKCYIGLDFGNQDDYTVLTIFDDNYNMLFMYRKRHTSYDNIIQDIKLILSKFKNHSGILESNNMGGSIYDQNRQLFCNFKCFTTTQQTK